MKIKLELEHNTQPKTNNYKLMTIYKNDPNYELLYTSKKHAFLTVRNVKIRKDNKHTKSHFFEILINQVQTAITPVYERGYRGNLHQFQCHTV